MENSLHYIELSKSPIRFDSVSQLTNVFFDESNKQIFAIRSNGTTGVIVKGPTESSVISFCMNDRGTIRSIKFSPDNQVLAVQRRDNSVEFICFQGDQPQLDNIITHQAKNAFIYGFVWVHSRECALISSTGVEIYTVIVEKRQVKLVKALAMGVKWFTWCSEGNIALVCSSDSCTLTPIIIKQKTITKLNKLDLGNPNREIAEIKVTLSQVYGTLAVLILQSNQNGLMEVEVHLLNGPGLAPRKCHILRLGHSGRFAINIVDNLIVVHHQASSTSLLFDIALSGETYDGITYHAPVTPGRSIRPFALKIPGISLDERTMQCALYSTNWVLFQPNIVIDGKLGCMWYLYLKIEPLCSLITDRVRLVEFLLQRTCGKPILLKVLKQLVDEQYNGTLLPILENIFYKINKVYESWVQLQLQTQTAQPSTVKTLPKLPAPPRVLIDQSDMHNSVFSLIPERPYTETVLILYLQSLSKHNIAAQEDLSKMIITELIRNRNFDTLRRLVEFSLLMESKPIACFLLSYSNVNPAISQIALDMLSKIKANEIIIEVLLGQGKVVDALRLAMSLPDGETISARKYLEAAQKSKDDLVFHTVFTYFQTRNLRQRGSAEFLKSEQCYEFMTYYNTLYSAKPNSSEVR
ncbi:regulator of MON1-CCZ1 complex [Episyrphus balteatus]|uniref:regulator of MON1-CCZ1 complex n=1 Tax=Episyrphus balteatus TaxID=286459 RepID=UPI0024856B4E|nr:regulator of MON1-CCZ1 complex [Episyrphus balteatus]